MRKKFAPTIVGIQKNGIAQKTGLRKGDKILSINGQNFEYYDEYSAYLKAHKNKKLQITINRNGEILSFNPILGDIGLLGVSTKNIDNFEYETKNYNFFQAIPAGISYGYNTLIDYIHSLRLIFTTSSGYKAIGGFGSIGSIFPKFWNWQVFWHLTAFLSIMLAFLNILPIPALDGGHVMFILFEMITRKQPSQKVLEYAQIVGFVIFILLLLWANGNDVIRWISG